MWRPPRSKRNQTSQDEKIDTMIGVVFFCSYGDVGGDARCLFLQGDIDVTQSLPPAPRYVRANGVRSLIVHEAIMKVDSLAIMNSYPR